ncbi:hypothetical protein GCM10010309_80220 [Streptomyces violaceochromogenes]|nr:hypothetical protein GCM10010309_80220 [Streptomyces violaceochromogenes]
MSLAVGFHQRYALGAQGADHPRELILMQKNRVGGGPHGTSRWPVSPPPAAKPSATASSGRIRPRRLPG